MVEWFCKQVQIALEKRFFYLYFAKGSLKKLNPFVLFKAKYVFLLWVFACFVVLWQASFYPTVISKQMGYNPGNGLELKILWGRIIPVQKMRKLYSIGWVQRLFCKFHHKKVSCALTKHSITILNDTIMINFMRESQYSVS